MKALFYGTPRIAVPFLAELAKTETVVGVVSQPDKPTGRGLAVEPTPVKKFALAAGFRVFQPTKPSELCAELSALSAELAVVVAYGKILKPDILAIPKLGTLNVHFSILPKYRGAAPVQWSLVRGETKTGVTLFWLDEGMDTGPVFLTKTLDIGPEEDAPALFERLTTLGLSALAEALTEIKAGRIRREPQTGEPSLAPLIKKEDARVDLSKPAAEIHNQVRGMRIWPRAYLELASSRILVLKTALEPASSPPSNPKPGLIVRVERGRGFLVQCGGSSRLWLSEVQPEGKKPIPAAELLNGLRLGPGDLLPLR